MQVFLCRQVPAADGTILKTDVYLPDGPGPFPAIITRTPYQRIAYSGQAVRFTNSGYAFAVQDVRGKFGSEGLFRPLEDEAADGQATIDWVANQRWCNGRIGLSGASYLGIVQVPAAAGGHPALKCIAPFIAPGSFFRDWARYDGCFALGNLIRWLVEHASDRHRIPLEHFTWEQAWQAKTVDDLEALVGVASPTLRKWLAHDTDDDYWQGLNQARLHEKIRVPGLHVGGWFDHISRGQFIAFRNIRDRGATPAARAGQRLLVGPWGHMNTMNRGEEHCRYGEWDFTPAADLSVSEREMQFLDYHLREIDDGYSDLPPVTLFLMGENRWASFADWPPPEARTQSWHLASGGSLTEDIPNGGADSYRYDPADPVPMLGGAVYWGFSAVGPVDQRPILDRADVLYYRSPVLDRPLAVIGDIHLRLTVASTAEDTDFIAKFCVEEPDGRVTVLTNGSLRCRFRESFSDPRPLIPGEPAQIRLHLGQTAYTFPAGSRLGLIVTSSEFPRILPHPNTMAPAWTERNPVVAQNSIIHGAECRLELPVVSEP
ncbi:MAG: CocE/NonD family hydrolase [Armatimonadota bacterium]